MRTFFISFLLLISAVGALGQHRWKGPMLDKANQIAPDRPADGICKDSSLLYLRPDGSIKDACEEHGGVKSWVKNSLIDLNGRPLSAVEKTDVIARLLNQPMPPKERHFSDINLVPMGTKSPIFRKFQPTFWKQPAPHEKPLQ